MANQNPGILPRSFDLEEYACDVVLVRQLEPLVMALGQLQGRLEDTLLAASSDRCWFIKRQSWLVKTVRLDALGRRFALKFSSVASTSTTTSVG